MTKHKAICSVSFLLLLFWAFPSFAGRTGKTPLDKESVTELTRLEDSLLLMADSMMNAPIPDDRIDYCVRFTKHLKSAMLIPNSFQYPFTRLSKKVHIIYSEDKTFRIFNWLIAPATDLRRYYGAVQLDAEDPKYFPLIDGSAEFGADIANQTLDNKHWYGSEIYKIMDQTIQGRKAYILFAFNSNGTGSNKKILDVLTLDENGATFGAPVFMMPNISGQGLTKQSRVIFEYKKTAQIYLNYDAEKKMIIFNRLASEVTDPNRKSTYIPTGQMDGLRWTGDSYQFVKDAVPVLKLQDGQAPIDGVMK
jgi:hypothetical protein